MLEIIVLAVLALTYMWDSKTSKKNMKEREETLCKMFDTQQIELQRLKEELAKKITS